MAGLLMLAAGCQAAGPRAAGPRGAAADSCYRHIYNSSGQPWTFTALASSGNVHFIDMPKCVETNGPCTIPAGATAQIQYTTTGGISAGLMLIMDAHLITKTFAYGGLASQCPRISHDGATGSVSLNDPATGDFSAQGDFW